MGRDECSGQTKGSRRSVLAGKVENCNGLETMARFNMKSVLRWVLNILNTIVTLIKTTVLNCAKE